MNRDEFYNELKRYNIFARRYFYPLITDYPCYQNIALSDDLKVSKSVSDRIITLPTYYDLPIDDVIKICDIIKLIHKNNLVRNQ
jgi:dTDP-4-amino-4,6-dideoxygalactose transaminase